MVYSLMTRLLSPLAPWGRMRVSGLEVVPADGPVLVVGNHDSQFDPVILGVALHRRRSLRFLAHASRLQEVPKGDASGVSEALLGVLRERVPPVAAGRDGKGGRAARKEVPA